MWKVGNIAPVSVLGVDSAYGFNITTERGQPLVFFAYATQAAAEAAAAHVFGWLSKKPLGCDLSVSVSWPSSLEQVARFLHKHQDHDFS